MDVEKSSAPFDWDEVRVFLAAYRCGSLLGAAQQLAISHSTVRRRLASLEAALGSRLFTATSGGLRPTEAADSALAAAESLELAATAFAQGLTGDGRALRGSLLVTAVPGIAQLIAPSVRSFVERHPHVSVTLRCENQMVDLARQEADLAIRLANSPDESLFGRRIGRVSFVPYASPELIARHGNDVRTLPWILWDPRERAVGAERWYAERSGGRAPVIRVSDVTVMRSLACAGIGGALLPVPLAEGTSLQALEGAHSDFDTDIWCLCHRDARDSERIRSFMREIASTTERVAAAHRD